MLTSFPVPEAGIKSLEEGRLCESLSEDLEALEASSMEDAAFISSTLPLFKALSIVLNTAAGLKPPAIPLKPSKACCAATTFPLRKAEVKAPK